MNSGWGLIELIVILAIALLILGAASLPEIPNILSKAIKKFRKSE